MENDGNERKVRARSDGNEKERKVRGKFFRGRGRGAGVLRTPLYKPKKYVPPQRVGFLCHFGLKTSIDI